MVAFHTQLRTKIHVPALRRGLILRMRLLELLDLGLEKKLILLSAPAGYGKTTLLCEWIANHSSDVKFAWLALDEADNDPTIYLQYVIAALQVVDANIGQSILPALQAPNPPHPDEFLPSLLNQINQRDSKIALVIDDYHLISEQSIHRITSQFIEQGTAGLHMVVATRADPPLPIYRYRAQGELVEVRQAQLRLTLSETREFLLQTVGDIFKPEEIDFLYQLTEGWAVGLLLAGLSLRESDKISQSIAALSGNQIYITEYLTNEVLDRQPEKIRDFLLKTSILKRLTGPLCDQLTGFEDGYVMLEYLKVRNLFVNALDDEQVWYRYHQLLADLLRRRLERDHKNVLPQLHKAASAWYAQNGFLLEAIEHAIASGDYPHVIGLIEGSAEKLWSRGEQALLLKQLQILPLEIIHTSAPVCLWYSVLLLFGEQYQQARELLQVAQELIQWNATVASLHLEKVLGTQALHAAYLALLDLNLDQVIQHAQQALEHLPKDWQTLRQMAQMMVADASNWRGDAIKAGQMYSELLETSTLQQNLYLLFTIGIRYALLNLSRGKLHQVNDHCLLSLHQLGDLKPRLAQLERVFSLILIEILIEWNHLEEVKNRLHSAFEGLKNVERSSRDILYLSIVRGYLAFNNIAPARQILELLEDGIRSSQMPHPYLSRVLAWKARIHLLEGNTSLAEESLEELGPLNCDKLAYQDETVYLSMVRVCLSQGKFQEAVELLEALQANVQQGGRTTQLIEVFILRAVAETMKKRPQVAQDYLAQAISLAEPEGFIRIFMDGGPVIYDLLREMVSTGQGSPYIHQLIAAFGSTPAPAQIDQTQFGLIEPFSERERQVLSLLRTHLSQQEMADELCVSVNTIRFHTKNIYRKLGAHDRSEAVEKAKTVGLL